MTQKEINMILNKTMDCFNNYSVVEVYAHIQAYRRALTKESNSKVSFSEALDCYINDVFQPVMIHLTENKILKQIVRKYGLSYAYLIITECLLDSKKLTRDEYLSKVSFRTEDLKKKIAA